MPAEDTPAARGGHSQENHRLGLGADTPHGESMNPRERKDPGRLHVHVSFLCSVFCRNCLSKCFFLLKTEQKQRLCLNFVCKNLHGVPVYP